MTNIHSRLLCLSTVFMFALACVAPPTSRQSVNLLDGYSIVDLSHTFESGMPLYPGGEPFKLTNMAQIEQGYYLNRFSVGEHVGTHVDAPIHFSKSGRDVSDLSTSDLVGPLVVFDITERARVEADTELTVDDVKAWEFQNGSVPRGAFAVVRSGWSKRWGTPEQYLNKDQNGTMRFPGISVGAAEFLVKQRDVKGLGIDTLSTDRGSSTTFSEHRFTLPAGKIHLENLTNLDALPLKGAHLMVMPLKIKQGSGSPARIVALVAK